MIIQNLATAMSGQVRVESTKGAGSTFSLVIPTTSASPDSADTTKRTLSFRSLSQLRVLIVDDNVVNRRIAKRMVEKLLARAYDEECRHVAACNPADGLTTPELGEPFVRSLPPPPSVPQTAEQGLAAVNLIRENPGGFDVVLLDLHMPVMDGLTAARALRALPGFDSTKTILVACTADVIQTTADECRAAGLVLMYHKPIQMKTLVRKLHQCRMLLNRRTTPSARSLPFSP